MILVKNIFKWIFWGYDGGRWILEKKGKYSIILDREYWRMQNSGHNIFAPTSKLILSFMRNTYIFYYTKRYRCTLIRKQFVDFCLKSIFKIVKRSSWLYTLFILIWISDQTSYMKTRNWIRFKLKKNDQCCTQTFKDVFTTFVKSREILLRYAFYCFMVIDPAIYKNIFTLS